MTHTPDSAAGQTGGEGIPVAPSMSATLERAHLLTGPGGLDLRTVRISALASGLGIAAALVSQGLVRLIYFFTQLFFYGRISFAPAAPQGHHLGPWMIAIPVVGGVIVGVMARYGSRAIRGHGIPEAMEQVLTNKSRIPPRMMFLKPLSSAVAIGSGGPFGAEGPIIATGGAMGSVLGQVLPVTDAERKTLLAAGAAAGMAATFGSPVSAVLLAVELLLFEFKPRSFVPVALAACAATAMRIALVGTAPAFVIPNLPEIHPWAIAGYVVQGALFGALAAAVTKIVYSVEDGFEKLPIHWMWWPAIGGVVVGICGLIEPRSLGVGYDNIEVLLAGGLTMTAVAVLLVVKFVSWAIALGSGTSGGTLAPLFTVGGACGALLGAAVAKFIPALGMDPRVGALVGMAAIFAGASRALLASVVFAFETTRQPLGLLPLLAGCTAAYLVAGMIQKQSIMTEKIARRGVRVVGEYGADVLARVAVMQASTSPAVTLLDSDTLRAVRAQLASIPRHQAFPVVSGTGQLVGVVSRSEVADETLDPEAALRSIIKRYPVVAFDDETVREAADRMSAEHVGRLPVLSRSGQKVVAVISRSDVIKAMREHPA